MWKYCFPAIFLVFATSGVDAFPGYIFTIPRYLWKGTNGQYCLSYHGDRVVTFNISMRHLTTNEQYWFDEQTINGESSHCIDFQVPDSKGKVNVSVVGRDESGETLYSEIGSAEIYDSNLLTLIQTDKPIYKPGQLVKFRILTITQNLKPRTGIIRTVSILNPSGVRVMQWKDVNASQGLVSFEFQLSKEPQLGTWKIAAEVDEQITRQTFKVKEYVLPKYEVTITPPKYLLPTSETIDGTVCAKYTYGKSVRGTLALKLCFGSRYHYSWRYREREQSSRRPCAVHLADINGCYSFSINSTELGLGPSRYGRWGQLIINATVEEQATGVVLEKQSFGPSLTFDPFRITIEDDVNSYFKPGIPYAGRIIAKKPDGTPAAGELIEVTGQNWEYDYHVRKNLTTDENGIARFHVTDIPTNISSINLNAKAIEYGSGQSYPSYGPYNYDYIQVNQPTTYHYIQKWYSPSNSYLQIDPVDEPINCGSNLTLTIHYTTPPNTNYKFHYIVMSNYRIIHSGHKHHHFRIQDTVESGIDTDSLLENFIPKPVDIPWWRGPDPPIFDIEPPMPPLPDSNDTDSTSTTRVPVRDPVPDPIPVNEEIIVPEVVNPLGNEKTGRQKEEEKEKKVPVVEEKIVPETASLLGREKRMAEVDDMTDSDIVFSDHLSRLFITIPVSAMMSPNAKVIVYFVREDLETVSSSREFKIEKCFNNNVTMNFVEKTIYPGNEAEIRLTADPGSLCSVGVVDKSINLLGGDHQMTPEKIFQQLKKFDYLYYYSYWYQDREYCRQKLNRSDGYSFNMESVDAIQAFRDMDLLVLSDLKIMTRPCNEYVHRPMVYYSYDDTLETPMRLGTPGLTGRERSRRPTASRGRNPQRPQKTRSFFPETWLWDLELIGESGEVTKHAEIPHTITKWVGNSICTNSETGIGISPMTSITAFQPFFLSFTLPYSAIRGEEIPVMVTIFNYMTESLVMHVSLLPSSGYRLKKGMDRSRRECVHGGESSTIKFYITPVELGKIKLTASAESVPDDGTCNNRVVSVDGIGANDAVRRELLIEPEGVKQEYTLSSYVCALGEAEESQMNLILPNDLVFDSERAYISVIGDIMGPALSNLNDLLRMPYGCGEQNMASMSPNIFVLQYLTNTNQLTDKIERQAKEYMRIGYQRQLNYRHSDGSYSAFGGSGAGSMWLTAFVVKCLGQSSPYINIDVEDLDKSTTWFRRKQLENGCFPNIGYTHSIYLKGGINSSNDLSMTAFVLISMLESGVNKSDIAVLNAMRCLDIHNATDTYTLALVAYAYTLFDIHYPRRPEIMRQLLSTAKRPTGDMMYWSRNIEESQDETPGYYRRASSAEVEITSYALLALITGAQPDAVTNARPVVLWLSKQRNGYGGFSSTQDTVIGLQALSRYATLVYSGDTMDITVHVSGEQFDQAYSITQDNSLVLQSTPLNALPNQLTIAVSGVGCALIQANVRYNIDKVPTGPAFDLKVGVYRSKTDRNNCAKRTMQICASYKGPGDHSHMAIVEVKMVTGWIPVKDTVNKLVKKNVTRQSMDYLGIEKVEIDQNYVNFYFNELDGERRCFHFDVEQNIEVSRPKPAFVKVYDYYETDMNLLREYSIKTICGTKEELPFLSLEDYLLAIDSDGPITQMRVPTDALFDSGRPPRTYNELTCPVCSNSDDVNPGSEKYKSLVCNSEKIYKVQSGRSGMYKMKIYADIRANPKIRVESFANYNMSDKCKCESLKLTDEKVLIFVSENMFDQENKSLSLDDRSTVVVWNKRLEKRINKLVRRRKGGCS